MNAAARRPFHEMLPAQQAGMLCNDPRFQSFAATRCGLPNGQFSATATAQYLRDCCDIASRRDLNNNQHAANKFQTLRTEFDAWAGRIQPQR